MQDFTIPDLDALEEDLHDMMYEWMLERVLEFYNVDTLDQLDEDQIRSVEEFAEEQENATGSLLAMKLHSLVYDWDN